MSNTPVWATAPFVLYLLLLAVLPLVAGHFWERNRNKLVLSVLMALPAAAYLVSVKGPAPLLDVALEYLSFMALLTALYAVSGGIYLRGSLVGTPFVNTCFLAVGAVLASVIGTTGASALLIRPLLRANQHRPHASHIVVFFIFIVANGAGMLTPLGDPPLFLGFLRGVPFAWTLRLVAPWALVNGALLVMFCAFETWRAAREDAVPAASVSPDGQGLRIEGSLNLLWLLGVVVLVFVFGTFGARLFPNPHLRSLAQFLGMAGLAFLSVRTTSNEIHEANRFGFAPLLEVAAVFVGIFFTMSPALAYLEHHGTALGITEPWQFFWATGLLSSFLDNAPTYLTFASLASGVVSQGMSQPLSASDLGALAGHPVGAHLLTAVSCGAVFMGAVTYIGNGPNFMVKAIAEQHQVRMPGFFGYMVWSTVILMPLFAAVTTLFF